MSWYASFLAGASFFLAGCIYFLVPLAGPSAGPLDNDKELASSSPASPIHDEHGSDAPLSQRIEHALLGALVADALCLGTHYEYNLETISRAYNSVLPSDIKTAFEASRSGKLKKYHPKTKGAGQQTDYGDQLLHAVDTVTKRGFVFEPFANAWRDWATDYPGYKAYAVQQALHDRQRGVPATDVGSHVGDLVGAARIPAMLLLTERVSEDELIAAALEMQLISHENPASMQAGEFLIRAALLLFNHSTHANNDELSLGRSRNIMVSALQGAATVRWLQVGIEDALAERQRRDAFVSVGVASGDAFAAAHNDKEVISRMIGDSGDDAAQSNEAGAALLFIIWLVIAYDTYADAVLANALLGGDNAARAIWVGLLLAARHGLSAIPRNWRDQLVVQPLFELRIPPFVKPLTLQSGKVCWTGERPSPLRVVIAAAIIPLSVPGELYAYRIFMRTDADALVKERSIFGSRQPAEQPTKPRDWDDEEDGEWEPSTAASDDKPDRGDITCLARYFMLTTADGSHLQLGEWPQSGLCAFTLASPVAYESVDIVLPEALTNLIGGVVIGDSESISKLPRLSPGPGAKAPHWAKHCEHVGRVRFPGAKWILSEEKSAGESSASFE